MLLRGRWRRWLRSLFGSAGGDRPRSRRRTCFTLERLEERVLLSAAITGTVFNDLAGSGVRQPSDPGVAGQVVFLDLNHDGKLDTTQTTVNATNLGVTNSGPLASFFSQTGAFGSALSVQNLPPTFQDVAVNLDLTNNSPDPIPVALVSPLGQQIPNVPLLFTIMPGQEFNGTFDGNSANPVTLASGFPNSSVPNGTYAPQQVFSNPQFGIDNSPTNGTWGLAFFGPNPSTDFSSDPSSSLTIKSWSLTFTTAEPSTHTGAGGNYAFTGLAAGSYQVSLVHSAADKVTQQPANPVTLADGQTLTGVDFGLQPAPDLTSSSFGLVAPATAWGQKVTVNYVLTNRGAGNAPAFDVGLYLSADGVISTSGPPLDTIHIAGGLPAGSSVAGSDTVTLPASQPAGFGPLSSSYIGLVIDPTNSIAETQANQSNQGAGIDLAILGPTVNTAVAAGPGTQQDPSVAVDPTDPQHLVTAYMDDSSPEVLTTSPQGVGSGAASVTPATMLSGIFLGAELRIDAGLPTAETVTVTGVTATGFTARFANAHNPGFTIGTGYAAIGVAVSTDGGADWTTTTIPVPTDFPVQGEADPKVAFDAAGNVYVSFLAATFFGKQPALTDPDPSQRADGFTSSNGIYVAMSTTGGATWGTPVAVVEHTSTGTPVFFEDAPALAVDTASGTPNFGDLYVTWSRFYPPGQFPGDPNSTAGSDVMLAISTSQDAPGSWVTQYQNLPLGDVTTSTTAVTTTGTPTTITVSTPLADIVPGALLNINHGAADEEDATVISVNGSSVTAIFSQAHAAGFVIRVRTTSTTAVTQTGVATTITPAVMLPNIVPGSQLLIDRYNPAGQETVTVTATTATTFTAVFTKTHPAGFTLKVATQGPVSAIRDPQFGTNDTLDPVLFSDVTVGAVGAVYVSADAGGFFSVYSSQTGGFSNGGLGSFASSFTAPNYSDQLGLPFFSLANQVFTDPTLTTYTNPDLTAPQPPATDNFRTLPLRQIAADPARPGVVYALAASALDQSQFLGQALGNPSLTGIDAAGIVLAVSTDYGLTWTSNYTVGSETQATLLATVPVTSLGSWVPVLNDENGGNYGGFVLDGQGQVDGGQAIPALTVNAQGDVAVIWYDTRSDPNGKMLEVWGTVSTDGGQHFSGNFQVTNTSFDPNAGSFPLPPGDTNSGPNFYLGDQIGLVSAGNTAYAVWTDTRNGSQDVFFSSFALTPAPAAPATVVPALFLLSNTLDLGAATAGTPGPAATFTVSGADLTAPVVITAPAGVQISTDGVTWVSSLTLTPKNGTLSGTTIFVRLAGNGIGGISDSIKVTSAGAAEQDVAVSGVVNPQSPAGSPPAPAVPLTPVVSGSQLTLTTPSGQVLSVQLFFGNQRLLSAIVVPDADGLPDVFFVLRDRHSHKLKVVRVAGAALLRLLQQLEGLPVGGVVAVLQGDSLQFIVGTERGVPVIDVYSGRTGALLRQFAPFPVGVHGVARVSLRLDDGVPELVVRVPGQRAILLDAAALLSGHLRMFGATFA
jgi:hypothetical protein